MDIDRKVMPEGCPLIEFATTNPACSSKYFHPDVYLTNYCVGVEVVLLCFLYTGTSLQTKHTQILGTTNNLRARLRGEGHKMT